MTLMRMMTVTGQMKKKNKTKYHKKTMAKYHSESCVVCQIRGEGLVTADHVKTIGSGGHPTAEHNLMPLCFNCHELKGKKGINFMAKNFPRYKAWLIFHGWEFRDFDKKWVRYEQ